MEENKPIGVRFDQDALIRAAEADQRPISSLARKFVVAALKKGGWLK